MFNKPVSRKLQTGANATTRVRSGGNGRSPPQLDVLERVQGVQLLDVHVLIAHLVGAAQAQSKQIEAQPTSPPDHAAGHAVRRRRSHNASRSWKHSISLLACGP